MPHSVALVHDYLTQRGGAERVVFVLTRAFPGAPFYTSLYEPEATFPEFSAVDVRPLPLNRLAPLRDRHRVALPLLAPAFSRLRLIDDVVVCSSSGWAHGARVAGRKIVYCHTPARWLYQPQRYLRGRGLALRDRRGAPAGARAVGRARRGLGRHVPRELVGGRRTDHADSTGSTPRCCRRRPPIDPGARRSRSTALEPGFVLCVSRLLPYKNLDAVVPPSPSCPTSGWSLVGSGPEEAALRALAGDNVTLLGRVSDEQLRWLYRECTGLVAASHEDFGLTPLEAAGFGHPSAVLRWGGFVDTVLEGETGIFFESPKPDAVADALRGLRSQHWDADRIRAQAERFSEARFVERIRAIVGVG